jgi:catechol 2,3-dioxygenase-like lactoylglutathione lyase family enzyme
MAVSGIAFTMYPVSDLPRAKAFYRDVLGLQPGGIETDYWFEFEVAGGTFGIGSFPQVGTPGTAQSLALEVPDLASLRETLAGRGIAVDPPHELEWCSIAVVRDPDGNQIWLHHAKPR